MGFLGESAPPASRFRLPHGGWHTASGRILGVSIAEPPKGIPIIPTVVIPATDVDGGGKGSPGSRKSKICR